MAQTELIAGLDIGSTAVRLVVGQRVGDGGFNIIAAVSVPAEGVNRGIVTSLDDATSCLSALKEKTERITGLPIESVWVGISGPHIITSTSRGVVAVGKANGEIEESDTERAIEAARAVATPPNYEILHVIPKSFTIDNQGGIKDPMGMSGVRLEVETTIIQGLSAQLKNVMRVVYRSGFHVSGVILSVLAAAESHATERQKELGVAVLNIGGATTSVAIFEEGDLLAAEVIPIGSEHVTADIAIGLRTSLDIADQVKLNYGTADTETVNRREDIDLSEFGGDEGETASRKYVAEIIEARMDEILEKVDGILKKIDRSGMLPAGVVLVGGGAKVTGLVELAKRRLRLPVTLGEPRASFMSAVDAVSDLSYASALGLVLWGEEETRSQSSGRFSGLLPGVSAGKIASQVKSWFSSLLP
ncbi:MAG: cell division protein FtsA [Patescibacteria group bacterium]